MTRVLYVDVIGGAAGDMLLAALLDAGAPFQAVKDSVEAVLPGRVVLSTQEVKRGGFRGTYLQLDWAADSTELGPNRSARDVREMLARADVPPGVGRRASRVLDALLRAEERVHGLQGQDLDLHEIGDDDTLVDVVGVAAAIDALDVQRVLVSPLPIGAGGTIVVPGSHPDIPIPAPATLELLRGFPVRGDRHGEEAVTPTAAAVFAALGEPADRLPAMTVSSIGYGAGARDPADHPNLVRVIVGETARPTGEETLQRDLLMFEANLDDLPPELVADAADALLAAGALDAWTTPVHMKKGRSGVVLSALCEPNLEEVVRMVFFESTSTFGVRVAPVRRSELGRRIVSVPVSGGEVSVKVGLLGGRVVSATPEHDDVAALATRLGRPIRDVYEEAAAAAREHRFAGFAEAGPR